VGSRATGPDKCNCALTCYSEL